MNECAVFSIFFIILKIFENLNNFKCPTKVENNVATEARLLWMESHESQLSIRCGHVSVGTLFFTFVAIMKFVIITKRHENVTNSVAVIHGYIYLRAHWWAI